MYNFIKPNQFIKPRKPNKTSGVVVLNSDDGELRNYIYWLPWFWAYKMQNNQFIDNKPLRGFSPNINTGFVGGAHPSSGRPMMNWEQILDMQSKGADIQSHGRYHVYLSHLKPLDNMSAGDTVISYDRANNAIKPNYKYTIEENSIIEEVEVIEYLGNNRVRIKEPLKNNFTTNARIHISEESAIEDMQGCLNDLAEKGIHAEHHVNPWYNSSPRTQEWQKQIFTSVLSVSRAEILPPQEIYLMSIRRSNKPLPTITYEEIDDYLLRTRDLDTALFVIGHGETSRQTRLNMKYLIKKASELGVEIVSHHEAIQHLIARGASK